MRQAFNLREGFGLILHILSVLLQQDIRVLFTGTFRRRDVVLVGFQSTNDLLDRFVIRQSAFSVKIGHYLVQALDPDLRVINKSQYMPTNCWRFGDSPISSAMLFML
jgi:hypothetical protein